MYLINIQFAYILGVKKYNLTRRNSAFYMGINMLTIAFIERCSFKMRHSRMGGRLDFLWSFLRPLYVLFLRIIYYKGLPRNINGTDFIRLDVRLHGHVETYEPAVWAMVMESLRSGDTFLDVGANLGLYSIAAAKRIGTKGLVVALEPIPKTARILESNLLINHIEDRTEVIQAAAGAACGVVKMIDAGVESAISTTGRRVPLITVDSIFPNQPVNVLKIDTEGYEEFVLHGSRQLLLDITRRPRVIFIEVHPFAWVQTGTSSHSILSFLNEHGYLVKNIDGEIIDIIDRYGEIVAYPVPVIQ